MKLITITLLAFLSLSPSATVSRPFTLPQPSPCSIPSNKPLFDDPSPSGKPLFDDPFPSSEPLLEDLLASAEPQFDDLLRSEELSFPAPSDPALFDEQPLSTDPPSFEIITCVNVNGCNANVRRPFTCTNSQGDIRPDLATTVLLLSEFDELNGSRITYRATVSSTATISTDPISVVPWISTADDAEPTICVEEEPRNVTGLFFASIGNPFGTCCAACSFLSGAATRIVPPPLSCCQAC